MKLLCLLIAGWRLCAQAPAPPEQPIPYSHRLHISIGLQCQDCHPNPDPGEHMTLPAAAKCTSCHSSVAKDRPSIQKLAELAKSKEPIPWVRIYAVAAGVYWSHRSHLEVGLKCVECHGDVAQMDRVIRASDVATMGGCIACHKARRAPTGCESCHEGK